MKIGSLVGCVSQEVSAEEPYLASSRGKSVAGTMDLVVFGLSFKKGLSTQPGRP
jgi:hypothetical protein